MIIHPIHVVFIQEHLPPYRVPFFSHLASRSGVDLTVITAGDESGLEYGQDNTKVYPFKWIRLPVLRLGINSRRAVFFKGLWKVIHDLQPQVIIMSSNYRLIQAWSLYAICKIRGFKILYWGHGFHHKPLPFYLARLERCLLKFIGNYCVDGMLVYADDGSQYLKSIGISPKRIFTFNNTLDVEGIRSSYCHVDREKVDHTLRRFGINSSNCLVYIGRMVKRKVPDIALQYWKEIVKYAHDGQLVMIGDGPLLEPLRKQADKTVVFTGAIFDDEQIGCIMKVARAVFCPGYAGLNVNHAFAYGKPFVVMNRNDHSPEV
jgi:glycosyltransferase involved in cell wall biosynthesis